MGDATATVTLTLDSDGLTDLQIIAQRAPGKGDAFRRMLARANLSQGDLAIAIGKHRTAISSWCSEDRWPTDEDMRRALANMGIDRKQLLDCWGVLLSTEISPKIDIQQLAVTLKCLLDFEDDPLERKLIIGRTLEEEVFIRQGFKGREDTRAAEFFMSRLDKYEELKQKRSLGSMRDVTPAQVDAARGNVYVNDPVTSNTTTPSEEQPDNGAGDAKFIGIIGRKDL